MVYYAKKINSEGELECLWTYDNVPPVFTEEDIGCLEITEEEYVSLSRTIIEEGSQNNGGEIIDGEETESPTML